MLHWLKFTTSFILFLLAYMAFTHTGWWCLTALIYAWLLIPLIELLSSPDITNLSESEEKAAKNDFHYDAVLYVAVVLHILLFIVFLGSMQTIGLPFTTVIARIATMGLLCSTFGINMAHELGHWQKKYEQHWQKLLC
ncbi:MAG: hypothetical protein K2W79_11815 [Hydrotalea flava]|uniref:hypothetical protein n=1 Tax=Hydrotalea TaxID=1004300 RepID=UPI0010269A37|nr:MULTISPECIES: hypothetical protein [Hydrotalea]MBY0348937.1 hypothetical protein [Hydrotalea flava]RWZ86406.1 MAG: hypothetical protein EO766_14320 [Hydrotalea sp. AMD]